MNKIYLVTLIVIIGLVGCGKTQTESPEKAEAIRKMSSGALELATTLSKNYPEHDTQYYYDKITSIIAGCVNDSDMNGCMEPKIKALYR